MAASVGNILKMSTTTHKESYQFSRKVRPPHSKSPAVANSFQLRSRTSGTQGRTQSPSLTGGATTTVCLYCFVACVSVLCYVNSLDGDFVHDDVVAVVSNPDVIGRTSLNRLFVNDFWGKPMADPSSHKSYRPLTVLTFRLNMAVGGRNARGFHLTNVFLHTSVVLLLMQLCKEVLSWRREAVATTALLFASHPVHTEAVSSIVGRADVLCCTAYLISLISFFRQSPMWLTVTILFAALALLAKEQGITVLAVCLSFQFLHLLEQNANSLTKKKKYVLRIMEVCTNSRFLILTSAIIFLVCCRGWLLHGTLPQFSEQDNPAAFSPSLLTRFLTYSYLVAFNSWLLLSPSTLSYDWQMGSIPLIRTVWDPRNLATVCLSVVLAAVCRYLICGSQGKERRSILLSMSVLVFSFLPASNLFVTVGFVVAERVLYIPSVGFCILVTHGLQRLMQRGPLVAWLCRATTCSLFFLFVAKTVSRNSVWASRETLLKSGIESVPGNAKAHYNYANLQKDIGQSDEAIKHYRNAIRLWPNHASAHNNLGTLLENVEDAESHFKTALRINPCHAKAHFNLANLYGKRGSLDVAEKLLQRAIDFDPEFVGAYSALAAVYADSRRLEEAEKLHKMAIVLDPDNADSYNNYGTFLQKTGRNAEAVVQYESAIAAQPNHTIALVNAAKTLRSMKNNIKAEELYRRALAIQEDPEIMDNLGVLYINSGRYQDAKQLYEHLQQKHPSHNSSKIHYAQLMIQVRSFQTAEHLLHSVTSQDKTNREALHLLSSLYSQTNRTAEALEYILRAQSMCGTGESECATLHADHGDILKDMNDFESAVQSYHLALMLNPKLAHVHLNLAVIYHIKGNFTDAKRHYQEAYHLDSSHDLLLDNMRKLKESLYDLSGEKCWRPNCRLQ